MLSLDKLNDLMKQGLLAAEKFKSNLYTHEIIRNINLLIVYYLDGLKKAMVSYSNFDKV